MQHNARITKTLAAAWDVEAGLQSFTLNGDGNENSNQHTFYRFSIRTFSL